MRVGYDIDGVLTVESRIITKEQAMNATRSELKIPEAFEVYLISGRAEKLRSITEKWLEWNHVRYEDLFLIHYGDRNKELEWDEIKERQAEWKAEKINNLDLDFYLEDLKYLVFQLKERCSDCKIIHYKGHYEGDNDGK